MTRDPATIFDELLAEMVAGEAEQAELSALLAEFEAETGLDPREDLAAPLGGEFAFAMDGPLLPEPAWKAIFEVYDPATFQAGLETLIASLDSSLAEARAEAAAEGYDLDGLDFHGLVLTAEERRGQTTYSLSKRGADGLAEAGEPLMHYRYLDGYLVASSIAGMLDRAAQYRSSGVNLRTAPAFDALLPPDAEMNLSALMYQNLAPVAGPLGEFAADKAAEISESEGEAMPDEAKSALDGLAGLGDDLPATLAYVYALPDRLVFAGSSDGGPLGMSLGTLLGINGLLGVPSVLDADLDAHHGMPHPGHSAPAPGVPGGLGPVLDLISNDV